MSLNEKLKEVKEETSRSAPPEALKIIGTAIVSLMESGILEKVPREGEAMVPFELPDTEGRVVSSADLLSKGPLVLHFYRGVW